MKKDLSMYDILRKMLGEINEQVVDHGDRVAYLYKKIEDYRGVEGGEYFEKMMLACYAHDIGAYKTEKFLDLLKFDVDHTLEHCIYGYLFMKYFSPLKDDAEVLLYHHTKYQDRKEVNSKYIEDSILIHLLDRIDVLIVANENDESIIRTILESSGTFFNPKDVDDFIGANEKYHILESLKDGTYVVEVRRFFDKKERCDKYIRPIIEMLTFEVDFKSEQTVIHSITTGLISEILGRKLGLNDEEIEYLEYASLLHDLGKIKVPTSIVEKPDKLTKEEYEIMKKHAVYTELIIGGLFPRRIIKTASRHHERLDGSGYPRGLTADRLSMSERILQVADVASALLQHRSYKEAFDKERVFSILGEQANSGKLDKDIIRLYLDNFDSIMNEVKEKSHDTIENYENLQNEYSTYLTKYSGTVLDDSCGFVLIRGKNKGV